METNNNNNKNVLVIGLVIVVVAVVAFLYYRDKGTTQNTSTGTTPELTQDQRKALVTAIVKEAKETNVIDISACKPFPETAQFKQTAAVTFKNQDSMSHEIVFTPQHKFTVPGKGEYKIVFDFFQYPGVRHYTCDSKSVGTVLIIK